MSGFALKNCESVDVTAENANIRFAIGHLPKHVEILNKATGAMAVWNNTMKPGEIFVISAGGGAGGVGMKTANGITLTGSSAPKSLVNQGVTYTDKVGAPVGNHITLTLLDPGANSSALAVEVDGFDIRVSLATDGAGAITTTATQLVAALQADASVSALISVSGSGATALETLPKTRLNSEATTFLDDEGVAAEAGFDLGTLPDFNDTTTETLSVTYVY